MLSRRWSNGDVGLSDWFISQTSLREGGREGGRESDWPERRYMHHLSPVSKIAVHLQLIDSFV